MTDALPLLPTMGVGSYASPGWLIVGRQKIRDNTLGPADIDELLEDATRIAIADQVEAGLDIISDGELRRQRFVYEMYDRLAGLTRVAPRRRVGVPGYDMAPHFRADEAVVAPKGLGVVAEFRQLKALAPAGTPLKVTLPGPLTFAGAIDIGERTSEQIIADLIALVHAELMALAGAGAHFLQLDEPSFPAPPFGLSLADAAAIVNRTIAGVPGEVAVHVCFGNNAGRPTRDRRMGRLFPAIETLGCKALLMEFANREMADLELMAGLARRFRIFCGVIDVKSFYRETAEDVARRIEQCLKHVPAGRLGVTADCGFSALPRFLAREKLTAMVAGARLARGKL
jgi:5-methyltetrahydropteroyltriglutamate--homocysteine methyltransferase